MDAETFKARLAELLARTVRIAKADSLAMYEQAIHSEDAEINEIGAALLAFHCKLEQLHENTIQARNTK